MAQDSAAGRLDQLHQRVAQVGKRYSQSEIARRTGSSRNNVSRYMRGAKMPLEFGAALSSELGVNPAWLLMGEGSQWLADNTAGNEKMAGDLLELVEAMNAVARMRLGSLTGKHHLRVLRELNDALQRYEELRKQLNVRTSPIFEDLLAQYNQAIHEQNVDRADDLRRALTQLARLNDVTALQAKFDAYRAHHEYIQGRVHESIEIQRDVLFHALSRGRIDDESLNEAHNLAMSLYQVFRLNEARRILNAALALTSPEQLSSEQAVMVDGLLGVVEVDLGDVAHGMGRVQRAAAMHPDVYLGHSGGFLVRAQLLIGTITAEAALSLGAHSRSRNLRILQWAAWLEDGELLKRACRECIGGAQHHVPEGFVFARYARAMQQALDGDTAAARTFLDERLGDRSANAAEPIVRFGVPMSYCRLARVIGDRTLARKLLDQAEQRMNEIPPAFTPDVMVVAAHHRNVLLLIKDSTRNAAHAAMLARARQFFRDAVAKGYGCFMSYLSSHAA